MEEFGVVSCPGGGYQEEGAGSYPTLPRVRGRTGNHRVPKLNQEKLPLDISQVFHCEDN